ncbi:MAG: hypothetical protein H6822_27395 [Planctomycetaceae bacterium]|nr:hypothetical protein [Planctomycetales bacterium]MCB9925905.1 hypothetical protein [Planctomycetaceae bacterium]
MGTIIDAILLAETAIGWDLAKIVVSGGVGFLLGVCKDKFTQPKRKLSCKASYCPIGSITEFRFMISHVGNTTAENVRMHLYCSHADKIETFCFCVDEQVKCDRLTIDEKKNPNSMSCTWSYINPGDDLELTLNIENCNAPDQVILEIDGKSTTVARKRLTMQCGC